MKKKSKSKSKSIQPVGYYGGKATLAPTIIDLMPEHYTYVEVFGGGGSVILRKKPSPVEVYNDLDFNVVNLFRQIRDNPAKLARLLKWTPYARDEQKFCIRHFAEEGISDLEKARRFFTVLRSSYSGCATTANGTFSSSPTKRLAVTFKTKVDDLFAPAERLRGVLIENLDFAKIIRKYDTAKTCFYIDPPYLPETRTSLTAEGAKGKYLQEMTTAEHIELLSILRKVKGKVILSGYASDLYDEALDGWERSEHPVLCPSAGRPGRATRRVEVLWLNFRPSKLRRKAA